MMSCSTIELRLSRLRLFAQSWNHKLHRIQEVETIVAQCDISRPYSAKYIDSYVVAIMTTVHRGLGPS
jgi:hypothetical protein